MILRNDPSAPQRKKKKSRNQATPDNDNDRLKNLEFLEGLSPPRLPVPGFLVDEDPRMGDERVDIEAIARRQGAVAHRLALVIDPVQDHVVQRPVHELNERSVHVVDRTEQRLLPFAAPVLHSSPLRRPPPFPPSPPPPPSPLELLSRDDEDDEDD